MKMTPNNFLYTLKQIVMGNNRDNNGKSFDGGIKVEKRLSLDDILSPSTITPAIVDSTGGTASATFAAITAGASYAQADIVAIKNALAEVAKVLNAMSNANGTINSGKQAAFIVPSGTNPAIGFVSVPIPRDYDEASDTFALKLIVSLANADAAITITGTPTIQLIGAAAVTGTLVSAIVPFSTATSSPLTVTEAAYEIPLSKLGLKRDSIISVALAIAGTTTGNTVIQAIEYVYDSTIVSYNETDSTTNTNSSTGNLLR